MHSNLRNFSCPAVVAAFAALASAQAPNFPMPLASGEYPALQTAVADFDGDGFTDVARFGWDGIFVQLADGNGGFRRSIRSDAFPTGSDFDAADFDGDGLVDLIASDLTSLRFFRNLGGGTFAGAVLTPMLFGSDVQGLGDVDSNGVVDVVSVWNTKARVSLGVGDGTFAAPLVSELGAQSAALALGDANGDGKVDLWIRAFVAGLNHEVALALGNGDGTFRTASTLPIVENAMAIGAADVNADGFDDAVVACHGVTSTAGVLHVFLGRADGSFVAGATIACSPEPMGLDFADVNLDGTLDLGVAIEDFEAAPGLEILLGDGLGGFVSDSHVLVGPIARSVRFGRFDADGALDAFVATAAGGVAAVRNLGTGRFESLEGLAANNDVVRAIAADLFGSPLPDLVATVVDGTNELALYENVGGGQFGAAISLSLDGLPYAVAAADLNHDGHGDLVTFVSKGGARKLVTHLGDGTGGFQALNASSAMRATQGLVLADVDNDGEVDALAPHYSIFSVQRGLGDGTFAPPTEHTILGGNLALGVADLNEDGWLDVVSLDNRHFQIGIALGIDGAHFAPPSTIACAERPMSLALADFDADGHVDIAASQAGSLNESTILVVYGDGTGGFTARAVLPGSGISAIVAADFDGDGAADLASCTENAAGMVIRRSQGRAFAAPDSFSIGATALQLGASDLDADGKLDVFATAGIASRVVVSLQR
ncbi:MAG: VCBS repeat-containing protein [Planctomycetes bacterium]|nr:VCBS repeat-containing protein [Planctomycetota bacterium]